ncbi:MAG TPA: lysophospholipid acyltransferase family protein [Thermoanaerobaculia bacterium]|nr:lysophospholipid acyltransferase family protein [Thermoanaerobaculia bacterium]
MLRNAWVLFVAFVVTIPIATTVIIIAPFRSLTRFMDWLIRLWARSFVAAAGIELSAENIEGIRRDERYILVSNHHSYFDIPCILTAVRLPIRFMAKASLFKIPIFGWSMARAGFIPIDRKNRRTAVKSFDLAAQRLRKGNTIVIFPEEGRSREWQMRPFQRGAFLLALKSELPLLPIAVAGTFDVFRVGARRVTPGKVTIRVGTPIATAGLGLRHKDALAEQSRAQIEAMLYGSAPSESGALAPSQPTA